MSLKAQPNGLLTLKKRQAPQDTIGGEEKKRRDDESYDNDLGPKLGHGNNDFQNNSYGTGCDLATFDGDIYIIRFVADEEADFF